MIFIATALENSIPVLGAALAPKDGVLVLLHDPAIDRVYQ
jgi:glycerophosphoryl diester phosphodiesterase